MTEVLLPIRTWSEPNLRGHWGRRARRTHKQREAVRLTRIGARRLDSDNLAAALKHVRDGMADALGMDDGDSRLVWLYGQRKGKPGEYAVLVEIQ